MKSFKSLVVSTLTAASTLMAVAVSTPAQACPLCGGVRLNGIELNGLRVNGPIFQGVTLQGPVLQGPIIQGPLLQSPVANGAHVGAFVAVTLPSGETIAVR
ncbi:hypothetical protein DFR24_3033 [Panacagrimonas perspica]|uniref:Secreted protein n=1 Tax=Panacagrimonas perspica TaxID=381431 RepID=A0A4R7P4S1_9GAMM|nr:hypothetical protein [Panacagrimonas perspica]TDU28658.1 hypothetical protein DFR24_3033 [Panacagrimonas perspica]THD04985.1 hypothetical protein B1810_03305 [Panacagrimonas perspica]